MEFDAVLIVGSDREDIGTDQVRSAAEGGKTAVDWKNTEADQTAEAEAVAELGLESRIGIVWHLAE